MLNYSYKILLLHKLKSTQSKPQRLYFLKRKTIPQNNFSSSGVPTVQTKFNSLRREFRQCKPSSVLFVGGSDSVKQVQFSLSGVPTVQTKFSSLRRGFRRCKPSSVLFVGGSDSANQVQFSLSGVPTVQTKFNSRRREFRRGKPSSIYRWRKHLARVRIIY